MSAALLNGACGTDVGETSEAQPRVERAKQALSPPQSICQQHPGLCVAPGSTNQHPFLGRGWNHLTDQDAPSLLSCLGPFSTSTLALTGARTRTSLKFISDVTSVKDTLQLDARISGGLPQASVPVSGSLYGDVGRTATAKSTAIQLMLNTRIEFDPQRITSVPALTSGALSRFDVSGAKAFRTLCGDRYVEQVTMGASFIAVLKFSSNNTNVQSHLRATLLASVGANDTPAAAAEKALRTVNAQNAPISANGSVTGSFENTVVEVSIELQQLGGPVNETPLTVTAMLDQLRTFPTSVTATNQLVPTGMQLKPYGQTSNFGVRQPFPIADATTSMGRVLGPAYTTWFDAYNELAYALSHSQAQFFPFNTQAMAQLMDEAAINLLDLEALIEACGEGQSCTEADMRAVIGTRWQTVKSELPIRKQLFTVTGAQFKEQADLRGAFSTKVASGFSGNVEPCVIDRETDGATAAIRNSVRVFSRAAIPYASSCRFKLFSRGRLASPWAIEALSADFDDSVLNRAPTPGNLTIDLTQSAQPWFWPISYVKSFTFAGPESTNPEAWRAAVLSPP